MAMSKRCFVLLLLLVVVALGGGVAIVVWLMNRNATADGANDYEPVSTDETLNDGFAGARPKSAAECAEWANSKSTRVEFAAKMGYSKLATRESIAARSGQRILRNAQWLTGDSEANSATLKSIEASACLGQVPVVVIKMRPNEGLHLHHGVQDWEFYKPKSSAATWKDYDKMLEPILKRLAPIPALVILEPDLLMYAYDTENQQHRWANSKYEDEFLIRAQRVIRRLKKSWVYVDAGNPAYFSKLANVEQMAQTLSRLTGLRGFSINALHFYNRTYTHMMARKLHCRTGLHYVVDTSRNGGPFSMQAVEDIQQCLFDPPRVKPGQKPGWSWGIQRAVNPSRRKRWTYQIGATSGSQQQQIRSNSQQRVVRVQRRSQSGHRIYSTNRPQASQQPTQQLRSGGEADQIVRSYRSRLRACVNARTSMSAHDANVWLKSPYESDGRLYAYGSLHGCLVQHTIECDDSCQMITHTDVSQRSSACRCESSGRSTDAPARDLFNFSNFPFGSER